MKTHGILSAVVGGIVLSLAADSVFAQAADFLHYAIPAMSNVQRLEDAVPADGELGGVVRIVAAKGEYEPGAFVINAKRDLGKVQLTLGEFKSDDGKVFPKENLDLKFLKVWYQNRNAWFSYFGDDGFTLVSELLLNDEELIRVDTKNEANYARLRGADGKTSEFWLNPPHEMDRRIAEHYRSTYTFSPMKADFDDAKTLRPVALTKDSFKTFFLTANVTKEIAPALYRGEIKVGNLGAIPVAIRVLPFELPAPKAFNDLTKDFFIASYNYISLPLIMEENGGDRELAKKQMRAVFKNLAEHNQTTHWIRGGEDAETIFQYELMKETGLRTDMLLGGIRVDQNNPVVGARNSKAWAEKHFGHSNVFIGHGDEPGPSWLTTQRPVFQAYQDEGFKFIIAGGDTVYYKAGFLYDWHNVAKDPSDRSSTEKWNALASAPHVAWYAAQHVGPENPNFNRMQYGLTPYLAGYSAACNYAHHFGPYNDDSRTYKPMVFAYGCYSGVIDTIQWEGFREGVDDIRYATLLKTLAAEKIKSPNLQTRYAANKATQLFASLDVLRYDPNAVRLEMIEHIMKLLEME